MRFDILTLFPEMFQGPLTESILKRAQQAGHLSIQIHNIRDYATDRHRTTDDYPYGGGAGMVFKPEPLTRCLESVIEMVEGEAPPVVLLTPAGRLFVQEQAEEWAELPRLVLICGHSEGIDERFIERSVSDEVSIGDYVLTGGELGAMVIIDAVGRLVPGVLDMSSLGEESLDQGLLEYPHYTRPANWRGMEVPPVLLSGHHGEVARWRHEQRLLRTLRRRPDLLRRAQLSEKDIALLRSWGWQPD